jgi:hypothetical protein
MSDAVDAQLFRLTSSYSPDPSASPASGHVLPAHFFGANATILALTESQPYRMSFPSDSGDIGLPDDGIALSDYDHRTLSISFLDHANPDFRTAVAGINSTGDPVFVSIFPPATADGLVDEPVLTRSWSSVGSNRTGVIWAGPAVFGKTVFYEGLTLRIMDDEFELAGVF